MRSKCLKEALRGIVPPYFICTNTERIFYLHVQQGELLDNSSCANNTLEATSRTNTIETKCQSLLPRFPQLLVSKESMEKGFGPSARCRIAAWVRIMKFNCSGVRKGAANRLEVSLNAAFGRSWKGIPVSEVFPSAVERSGKDRKVL